MELTDLIIIGLEIAALIWLFNWLKDIKYMINDIKENTFLIVQQQTKKEQKLNQNKKED